MTAVTDWSALWHREAPPRTHVDAQFLARYQNYARPAIVAAALLPLVVDVNRHQALGIVIGVGSWLVFVMDFVIQVRTRVNYVGSRSGLMDLVIVILTSPWYLIPGVNAGAVVTILRLARVARLLLVFRGARRLLERLGRASLVAVGVVFAFSWIAYDAENPVNPEFASYGDSLWWGIVTLTTVGYGDIVPITAVGRYAGVIIMIMGVGLLGVLAGALASFFKLTPKEEQQDAQKEDEHRRSENESADDAAAEASAAAAQGAPAPQPGDLPMPPDDDSTSASSADVAALTREVIDLRAKIQELSALLTPSASPGSSSGTPGTPSDNS